MYTPCKQTAMGLACSYIWVYCICNSVKNQYHFYLYKTKLNSTFFVYSESNIEGIVPQKCAA